MTKARVLEFYQERTDLGNTKANEGLGQLKSSKYYRYCKDSSAKGYYPKCPFRLACYQSQEGRWIVSQRLKHDHTAPRSVLCLIISSSLPFFSTKKRKIEAGDAFPPLTRELKDYVLQNLREDPSNTATRIYGSLPKTGTRPVCWTFA